MGKEKTVAGEVALDYVRRWPDHPSKTIARMLVEHEPKLFADVEHARTFVRRMRGNHGDDTRRRHKDMGTRRPNGSVTDRAEPPLPAAIEALDPWRVVPVEFRRALVISDVHVPFHDREALQLALAEGKRRGVDAVIINGDLMDCYAVSFWERDPRRRDLERELETGRRVLEVIRERFPKSTIWYKEGNHEERLWRFVWARCPELAGVTDGNGKVVLGLASLMDAAEYGVEVVADKKPILAGPHLYLLHGHEFRTPFTNPVNPARGLYLRAKANAICGDLHQTSAHTESGLERVTSCWSTGCLCDLHPGYMPLNKWNHGFAVVELYGDRWSVENLKVIKGAVV